MKKLNNEDFASLLFQFAASVQFTHLNTEYDSHKILNDLIIPLDELLELSVGYYGFLKDLKPIQIEFLDIESLTIYRELLSNQCKLEEKEDFKNKLAEAVEVISKALYLFSLLDNPLQRKQ